MHHFWTLVSFVARAAQARTKPAGSLFGVLALSFLLLTSANAGARPGTHLWTGRSTGPLDAAIAVANDGSNTVLLAMSPSPLQGVIEVYNGGALTRRVFVTGFPQMNLTSLAVSAGTIYVAGQGSLDPLVRAYSLTTGQLKWSKSFGGGGSFQRLVVEGSRVYVAGTLGANFHVVALDTALGAIRWSYRATNGSGASALAVGGGRVVAGGFPAFVVRSFDAATGQLLFENSVTDASAQAFDLAISGSRAFAVGSAAGMPLTRAFDLATNTWLWAHANASGSGATRAVAATATSLFTTGRSAATSSDLFVEAADPATGARRWLDVFNPGQYDIGTAIAARGERVYAVGVSTRANGDEDQIVRAYGAADGYLHWSFLSPEVGNVSASAVTTDDFQVLVAGQEPNPAPGATSRAFVTGYAANATGGAFIDKACPARAGFASRVRTVATLPRRVYAVCEEESATTFVPSRQLLQAYDLGTGALLWSHNFASGLVTGSQLRELHLATVRDQVVAIGVVERPGVRQILIRSLDPEGSVGTPVVLWTQLFAGPPSASFKTRIAAREGMVVTAAPQAAGLTTWVYDLRTCRTGSCPRFSHTLATGGQPEGIAIHGQRAVVGVGTSSLETLVFENLTSGIAQPQLYRSVGDGIAQAVTLTDQAIYSVGTGLRDSQHTYYAARQTLGSPSGVAWYDKTPLVLQSPETGEQPTHDGWGVASSGNNRIYGCGYALDVTRPRHLVVRAYDALGGRVWNASFRRWNGVGSCESMTATPNRAFVVGNDSGNGQTGRFLVASFLAATGQDDWVDRSLPTTTCGGLPCSAVAVATEGEYVVAGGTSGTAGRVRIYSAACSKHGVEAPCP